MNVKVFHTTMLILIPTLVIAGGVSIIAWRVVLASALPPFWNRLLLGIVIAPIFFPALLFVLKYVDQELWFDRLLALSFMVTGFFSFLLVFALFRDALHGGFVLLLRVSESLASGSGTLPGQISFVSEKVFSPLANTFILLLSFGLFAAGLSQALSFPRIKQVTIPVAGLHPALHGFKIVQLSDIHLDVMTNGRVLEKIVQKVNEIGPDMTAITGDLVDGSVRKRGADAKILERIASPVFFVNGNHEYYFNAPLWNRFLSSIGVTVLNGDTRTIKKGAARIVVGGISDLRMAGRLNREASIPKVQGADFHLLLSHRPGAAFEASRMGYDLQLSGHTHGGQFFPWTLFIQLVEPFAKGINRHNGMWIYTSLGTGFWGPPVRLFAPQEITVLTLQGSP
jgi:predicted MPP superfamily phosphohydrolase